MNNNTVAIYRCERSSAAATLPVHLRTLVHRTENMCSVVATSSRAHRQNDYTTVYVRARDFGEWQQLTDARWGYVLYGLAWLIYSSSLLVPTQLACTDFIHHTKYLFIHIYIYKYDIRFFFFFLLISFNQPGVHRKETVSFLMRALRTHSYTDAMIFSRPLLWRCFHVYTQTHTDGTLGSKTDDHIEIQA